MPNSAAIEQLFSQFGVVHTKHQNRLHHEKGRKTVLVQSNTNKKLGFGGKRKHSHIVANNSDSAHNSTKSSAEALTSLTFSDVAAAPSQSQHEFRRLLQEFMDKEDILDAEMEAAEQVV